MTSPKDDSLLRYTLIHDFSPRNFCSTVVPFDLHLVISGIFGLIILPFFGKLNQSELSEPSFEISLPSVSVLKIRAILFEWKAPNISGMLTPRGREKRPVPGFQSV